MLKPPDAKAIGALLVGGAGVQLRSLAQNITFLAVTRTILTMDSTGTAAAAHTVSSQVFQLGAIAILALSTIATILIPQRMHSKELGGPLAAKAVADRLLAWGILIGVFLFFMQSAAIFALPFFTPIKDVQTFAVLPTLIGAALQPLNGIVFVAEGLMQGHQAFLRLAGGMFVSTGVMLTALRFEGSTLPGVWMCFAAFNTCRLLFALRHHFVDGPLGWKHLNANQMKWEETNKSA
jgi:Na+-driven multidrug efflux pump